jgi:hypothetical protein
MAALVKNPRFNVEFHCERGPPAVSVEKGLMKDSKRNSRIRLLVKHLNRRRKKQAAQIDLLCNDIITAHNDFLDTVRTLTFAGEFYESLIGVNNLDNLFCICACLIKKQIPDVNLAFFLSQPESFQLYAFDYSISENETDEAHRLERYFTGELVESITRANRPCEIDDLLQMGLQVSPSVLKGSSAITVPIAGNGPVAGFMFLYRYSSRDFDRRQIKLLCAVRRGLSRAIRTCAAEQPRA